MPAEWTRRPPLPLHCGATPLVGPPVPPPDGGDVETCLVDALAAGRPLEHPTVEEGLDGTPREVVLRVEEAGALTVTRRPVDSEGWTEERCTTIVPAQDGWRGGVTPTDCGVERPLALDPP